MRFPMSSFRRAFRFSMPEMNSAIPRAETTMPIRATIPSAGWTGMRSGKRKTWRSSWKSWLLSGRTIRSCTWSRRSARAIIFLSAIRTFPSMIRKPGTARTTTAAVPWASCTAGSMRKRKGLPMTSCMLPTMPTGTSIPLPCRLFPRGWSGLRKWRRKRNPAGNFPTRLHRWRTRGPMRRQPGALRFWSGGRKAEDEYHRSSENHYEASPPGYVLLFPGGTLPAGTFPRLLETGAFGILGRCEVLPGRPEPQQCGERGDRGFQGVAAS